MRFRAGIPVVVIAVTLLAAACGGESPATKASDPSAVESSSTSARTATGLHVSRVRSYGSLRALAADSSEVVEVVAGTATEEVVNTVPFIITEVKVTRSFRGEARIGDVLKVRQTGTVAVRSEDLPPVMTSGRTYLLFLTPFTNPDPTGEMTIVGLAGIFEFDGGKAIRLDPSSVELPSGISVDGFESQVRSALDAPSD